MLLFVIVALALATTAPASAKTPPTFPSGMFNGTVRGIVPKQTLPYVIYNDCEHERHADYAAVSPTATVMLGAYLNHTGYTAGGPNATCLTYAGPFPFPADFIARNNGTFVGEMELFDAPGQPVVDQWSVKFHTFGQDFYMDLYFDVMGNKMQRVVFLGGNPVTGESVIVDFTHWSFTSPDPSVYKIICAI